MNPFDRLVRVLFIATALFFTGEFCKKQTDTFTMGAISSNRPYSPTFATRPLLPEENAEVEKALSQPYVYFGCGGQAYALFSADGQYVVKFFKQRLFRPPHLLNLLPLPKFLHRYRDRRNWKRLDKLQRDFFSYKVSFDQLQTQTGVIYTHLNRTQELGTLEVIDRLGIHHRLDLDRFDFLVQRMAERTYDRIDRLMQDGDIEAAKRSIRSIFELISTRAKMGYRDRDPNIRTNCGFIGERAVKIDVGRFVISEEMRTKEGHNDELQRIAAPFGEWIEKTHPELHASYHIHLEEVLD